MHSRELTPVLTVDTLLDAEQVVPHVEGLSEVLLGL